MFARRVLGRAAVFATLCLLASTHPAAAQQPADQATINARIEMGKKFLQKEQKALGHWGTTDKPKDGHNIGYTALVGLTLVECGVPTTDPGLKKAANIVRGAAVDLDSTYELALAILFLDRMKDKVDKRVIQFLAGRLISAQMPSGGWGYKTHKYNEPSILALLAGLRKLSDPTKDADLTKIRASLPDDMRRLAVIIDPGPGRLPADAKDKRHDLFDATTDNSNTHFAMLGLWAARKYDIPVDRTFMLVNRRFRTSQGTSGTWAYDFVRTGADGSGAHTCIALLGVAIGHVVAPEPGVKPEADPVILNAFVALSKSVGEPAGDIANRPTVKAAGGLYFLWAMERIAVLYDLQKLGKKDWYQWGAEILVCNQAANGSWDEDGGYPGQSPIVNTCFALLFLKRANLTPDLSKRLVVDTGVLTAKVDDKITPKVEPPPPSPKVEEPPPSPKVEPPPAPKVEPKKEPPAPTPAPLPTPPQETSTPAPAKKTPWLWIVLGVLIAGLAGGGLAFFFVAKRGKKDQGEEGEKKKKKKKKVKADSDSGEAQTAGAKKAKPKVEVEEDDE
jgi:hypothetical protein